MKKYLIVTGGLGFIGSNFIRLLIYIAHLAICGSDASARRKRCVAASLPLIAFFPIP